MSALLSLLLAAAAPVHSYASLSMTPDGARLASIDQLGPGTHGAIVVRTSDGAIVTRYDPCAKCDYAGVAWAPDGKRLAVLAERDGGASLIVIDGGRPRTLASIEGPLDDLTWSPDGTMLAVLATLRPHKPTGATQPGVRQVGEIGTTDDARRIAVVAAAGGALDYVSPPDTYVYEYGWRPDGGFVATAAKGNGDNNWWVARLMAFERTGAARTIAAPPFQMNAPHVSPDGRTVALIGGLMSDFGSVGGDVWTVPTAGGEPVDVTPGFGGSVTSLRWAGERIVASVIVGGETGTASIDPRRRTVSQVATRPLSIEGADGARFALDAAGKRMATVTEGFAQAPRIEFGPIGATKPITHDNDALTGASVTNLTWRSGGHDVQGWLMRPTAIEPGRRYPMVTVVHGGPAAAVTPRYDQDGTIADLLAHGYYVLQPNPRGSFGQGEAFTRANVKDFGGGDLTDILAGIDAAEQAAPIDDARLGIYGHSYGGFMTMWAVTHSKRFAAAVAGAGIANWSSYYGQNGIDQWMIPYFGASFYDDPAVYDRLSPIRSIRAAATPTFVYVGERDVETPAAQSLEFWHGMRAAGAPVSLVIYPDEGHGIRQPEHVRDLEERIVGWFDRYLQR